MKADTHEFAPEVRALEPELLQWRRQLHQNPELSFHETQTSAWICSMLDTFDGVSYTRPTPTSVMAVVRGEKAGRTIAIRADIDALPSTSRQMSPSNPHGRGSCTRAAMMDIRPSFWQPPK